MKVGRCIWLAGWFWAGAWLAADAAHAQSAAATDAPPIPLAITDSRTDTKRGALRRSIGGPRLTSTPGTRGDGLRAATLLPGVTPPALLLGGLPIRGGGPHDSAIMLEGLPIANAFHLGALSSFMNTRWLERIDVYPSNYSSRFGRKRSGIVDLRMRELGEKDVTGQLDLNTFDASVTAEAPLGKALSMGFGLRRSHLKYLQPAFRARDLDLQSTPVYSDYQWITSFRPSSRDRLRLMVFGSGDDLHVRPIKNGAQLPDYVRVHNALHRAQLSWQHRRPGWEQDVDLAVGTIDTSSSLAGRFRAIDGSEVLGRAEWRLALNRYVKLSTGADLYLSKARLRYQGPPPVESSNHPAGDIFTAPPAETLQHLATDDHWLLFKPALYLDAEFALSPLRLVVSSRLDYDHTTRSYSYDPRVVLLHNLNEQLRFRAGAGVFSQAPDYIASHPVLGNPTLQPSRTLHLDAGVDCYPLSSLQLSLDAYYKYLGRDIVSTFTGEAPGFTNGGEGRMFGVEFLAVLALDDHFSGQVAYSWSRSERTAFEENYLPFTYDQPHVLSVSGHYRTANGWELGATFRLASGRPYTPIRSGTDGNERPASYDLVTGQFAPAYLSINSARDPFSHRLDLHVEKRWQLEGWAISAYLDIQNVYNTNIGEGRIYSRDYEQNSAAQGLPLLPTIGMRGEL